MAEKYFISKNTVKTFFNQRGARVSSDFYYALDTELNAILRKALERAKKNLRSTVASHDI